MIISKRLFYLKVEADNATKDSLTTTVKAVLTLICIFSQVDELKLFLRMILILKRALIYFLIRLFIYFLLAIRFVSLVPNGDVSDVKICYVFTFLKTTFICLNRAENLFVLFIF